jgi:hypothetical protein
MIERLVIYEEKTFDKKPFFTISGKDGAREYYRLGPYATKAKAQKEINRLLEYKTRKEIEDDLDD